MRGRDFGYAVLSGLMLASTFPPLGFEALAWIALFPLLWVLEDKRPHEGFTLGFVAGFIAYGFIIWWVQVTMVNYGKLPGWLAWILALALAAYVAVYVGLFAYLLVKVSPAAGFGRFLMAPVIWVALELARAYFLSGFPWALLGYSQYKVLPAIQIADIVGVYGVSFFIVFVNAAFWHFFRHPDRAPFVVVVGASVFSAMVVGYGYYRILNLPKEMGPPSVPIGIVQPDTRPGLKWRPGMQEAIITELEKLTGELVEEFKKGKSTIPPLVVWPEAAAPVVFSEAPAWRKRIGKIAQNAGVHLLFGTLSADTTPPGRLFNSAYLLEPGGNAVTRYDKMHLVPFGEYVPWRRVLFFVDKLVPVIGRFGEGKTATLFETPGGKFGVLICFEVIFPRVVRQMKDAQFLVNITNDAWFGRTAASEQHLSMVAMRAVEYRVPVVRSANSGISSVIDATGHIRFRSPLFEKWRRTDLIAPRKGPPTIYARIGDVFAYMCAFLVLMSLIVGRVRGQQRVWYA
jgi:apolipoprotein N-acyltransferase